MRVFSTPKLANPEQMASATKLACEFIFMRLLTFCVFMNNLKENNWLECKFGILQSENEAFFKLICRQVYATKNQQTGKGGKFIKFHLIYVFLNKEQYCWLGKSAIADYKE